jgi:hypothetical protein
MSDREIAQRIYSEKLKAKNPSAFDTMGAFNKSYNDARKPTSLAAPADFGKAVPPKNRADAQDMFYRQQQVAKTEGQPGFWGRLFAGMEKAYNLSSQAVSFGLLLGEESNPLFEGKAVNPSKIRESWDKARTVSPGRAFVRTFIGQPVNLVEDAINAATLGNSRNNAEKFIKDHLLFAANDFDIYDKNQAEKAFREQTYGRFSSWGTDVVARFVLDPTLVAGKLLKGARAAQYAVEGVGEVKAVLAGEKTGRRAERIKATLQDFVERTDGLTSAELFRVKSIRESAAPAAFSDLIAKANKIEDTTARHAAKTDIVQWAMGDAAAATRLLEINKDLAADIANLQDEIVGAKFFGAGVDKVSGQYTMDLVNQGDNLEKNIAMAAQYEQELASNIQKLNAEAIINPNMIPRVDAIADFRTAAFRSQGLIDLRSGAASTPVRIITGFAYKRPKGWIDFRDNQSLQTVDNMLSRVRGVSEKQENLYRSKIAQLENDLKITIDETQKKVLKSQIDSTKRNLELSKFTVERKNELFNKYVAAIDDVERANVYQEIERELFDTISRQFGYTNPEEVRRAWGVFAGARARAHNLIRERAYTGAIDPATGGPVGGKLVPIEGIDGTQLVIPMPLNEAQLVKELPTLDIDGMYAALTKAGRASRFEPLGAVYGFQRGVGELAQSLDSLIKFEVLARIGYPIRSVTEGFLRIANTVGAMAILNRTGVGLKNIVVNRFKDAKPTEVFDYLDGVKLNTKKAELLAGIDNADDPELIRRQIEEIDGMLEGRIKIKDKFGMGLRQIKIGDEVFTYEDALGATPAKAKYIQERFIANAATLMDNAFSESSTKLRNATELSGDWVVIKGSDENWAAAYERVVNRQLRGSKLASILLEDAPREQVLNKAKMFLLKNPEGRQILKNLALGRNVDELVEANMKNIEGLFPSYISPELKRIASTRNITASDIEKYIPVTGRPDVNAAQVSTALGRGSVMNLWANFLDNFYKGFGELPESKLVRNPLFVDLYRKRMDAVVKNAIETYPGDSIPPEYLRSLENKARQWARAEMRRTLYDTSERVDAASTLRYIFPFFGAFADVAEKWGRIILNDPSVIRKLETIYDSPDRSGMVEERDGIKYINIPGEWSKWLRFDSRPFSIPKPSLNLIYQGNAWWNPGAGWFVQYPLSVLVKRYPEKEINRVVKEILPYGPQDTKLRNFLIQNAALRRAFDGFDPESPLRSNLTVLVMAEESHKYATEQRDTAPTPGEINNKVKWIIALDVVSRITLPFATQTRSPYQFWIDEYQRMREEDPLTATEKFYEKYGDEYYYFTTNLSKNYTGVAATIEADKRAKQLSDLIATNPEYGWFLVGDANAGEFSPTVYRNQRTQAVAPGSTTTFRGAQDPYEAIQDTNAERGWILYNKAMDRIEAERINRGLKSLESRGAEDLKQMRTDFIAALSQEVPDWAAVRGKIDTRKVMNFLTFADKAVNDPRLSARSDMKTMADYLKGRSYVIEMLSQRKSKNINNAENADLKELWGSFTGALIDRDVTFNRVYTRILENDTLLEGL